jgi:hypothetical protein
MKAIQSAALAAIPLASAFAFNTGAVADESLQPPFDLEVTIANPKGKPGGTMLLEVTAERSGGSCLGDFAKDAYLVRVKNIKGPIREVRLGARPVAEVHGGHLRIDMSGGICDAYFMLEGEITSADAFGAVYTFGLNWAEDLGTFMAIVKSPR